MLGSQSWLKWKPTENTIFLEFQPLVSCQIACLMVTYLVAHPKQVAYNMLSSPFWVNMSPTKPIDTQGIPAAVQGEPLVVPFGYVT